MGTEMNHLRDIGNRSWHLYDGDMILSMPHFSVAGFQTSELKSVLGLPGRNLSIKNI